MTELLKTDHLTKHFKIGNTLSRHTLHAVDDVSFTIGEREIVALAGESGSGKSTIARLLARIYKPTAGTITFDGQAVAGMRSRHAQLKYAGEVPNWPLAGSVQAAEFSTRVRLGSKQWQLMSVVKSGWPATRFAKVPLKR